MFNVAKLIPQSRLIHQGLPKDLFLSFRPQFVRKSIYTQTNTLIGVWPIYIDPNVSRPGLTSPAQVTSCTRYREHVSAHVTATLFSWTRVILEKRGKYGASTLWTRPRLVIMMVSGDEWENFAYLISCL